METAGRRTGTDACAGRRRQLAVVAGLRCSTPATSGSTSVQVNHEILDKGSLIRHLYRWNPIRLDCSPTIADVYSPMRQRFRRDSQGGRADGRSAYGGPIPDGVYSHGNDPNFFPQEGDWVYHDLYCRNLNFARRTHCDNNNKHRYGPELAAPSHTSWRASRSPSRTLDRTSHVLGHDIDRYGSLPHHGWGVEDPRMPPPGCGAKFAGSKRRERENYQDELEYRRSHQLDRPAALEWDGSDGNRDTRQRLMTSRRQWISRERSRSPLVDRPVRGSLLGNGRDDKLNTAQRRGYRQVEFQRKRRRAH